jgi:hypothetical protein
MASRRTIFGGTVTQTQPRGAARELRTTGEGEGVVISNDAVDKVLRRELLPVDPFHLAGGVILDDESEVIPDRTAPERA